MKAIINILIVLAIIGVGYLLVSGIQEPIKFKAEKEKRERAVVEQLKKIRQTQEIYREVTGQFAPSFDTLSQVIANGQIPVYKVIGDPDDVNNTEFTIDTLYFSAADSVNSMGINVDSLRFVPYTDGVTFEINADTMTYQKTLVSVVEVGVQRAKFMGPYASQRFAKYDDSYKPQSMIKFGDMTKPTLSGNWE
jgi:type II secretory pathway pseudopilin PulG